MSDAGGWTWLGGLVAHHARREAKREDRLSGLILGIVASGFGLLVLGTWCASLVVGPISPWCEWAEISREVEGSEGGLSEPRWVPATGRLIVPSGFSTAVGLVGTVLASIGIQVVVGRNPRARYPLLCLAALVLCLVPIAVPWIVLATQYVFRS